MSRFKVIKETMEFLKLDNNINLNSLFKDAENDITVENLVSVWYNVKDDPGLSEMILKEITKLYELAQKN